MNVFLHKISKMDPDFKPHNEIHYLKNTRFDKNASAQGPISHRAFLSFLYMSMNKAFLRIQCDYRIETSIYSRFRDYSYLQILKSSLSVRQEK